MCSYFREGSVCTVPNSDGKRLAEMFGSRDPDKIIDALGEWNQKMAARALDSLDDEMPEKSALDPTVSTALKQVFDNGVKLAKLINPNLDGKGGGGTTVNVGINMANGQRPQVTAQRTDESHTRELAATVIAELEAEGYQRSQITETMVREKLKEYVAKETGHQPKPTYGMQAIEGEVVEDD